MSKPKYTAGHFIKAIKGSKGVISVIASRVPCDRSTVYRFIEDYPTVKQALHDEREGLKDFAESKLFQQMNIGNMTAIIFYLKTQARDRGYVEKINIEGNVQIEIINQVVKSIEQAGLNPAEVFNELIAEMARASTEHST